MKEGRGRGHTWEGEVFTWFSSFRETPLALTQGSGTHANLGATWN